MIRFLFETPGGGTFFAQHGMVWLDGEFVLAREQLPPGSGVQAVTGAEDVNQASWLALSVETDGGLFLGAVAVP